MTKKISRNAPCPCGSGRKYKHCCIDKGFDWVERENGSIGRQIPLDDDLEKMLSQQRQRFVEEHGREPGPEDLLFFDTSQEEIETQMDEALAEAGIQPELIYAYKKTGRMVTELNVQYLTDEELQEWEDAINEYYELEQSMEEKENN